MSIFASWKVWTRAGKWFLSLCGQRGRNAYNTCRGNLRNTSDTGKLPNTRVWYNMVLWCCVAWNNTRFWLRACLYTNPRCFCSIDGSKIPDRLCNIFVKVDCILGCHNMHQNYGTSFDRNRKRVKGYGTETSAKDYTLRRYLFTERIIKEFSYDRVKMLLIVRDNHSCFFNWLVRGGGGGGGGQV